MVRGDGGGKERSLGFKAAINPPRPFLKPLRASERWSSPAFTRLYSTISPLPSLEFNHVPSPRRTSSSRSRRYPPTLAEFLHSIVQTRRAKKSPTRARARARVRMSEELGMHRVHTKSWTLSVGAGHVSNVRCYARFFNCEEEFYLWT